MEKLKEVDNSIFLKKKQLEEKFMRGRGNSSIRSAVYKTDPLS